MLVLAVALAGSTAVSSGLQLWQPQMASAIVFDSLFAIVVILSLAVIGTYAGKGPVWALSTPLVALSALASVTILWIGRTRTSLAVGADKAAVTPT